jgi:tetratricopeptide (TPR) repeat protein
LNGLANSYSVSGQPRRAVLLFEGVIAIFEKQGTKSQLAAGLGNLAAMAHIPIGALRAAEVSLRRSIALCREVDDEFGEAVGHQDLALLLVCRGADAGFEEAHQQCIALATKMNNHQIQCEIASHAVMRSLLRRDGLRALEEAKKARELADVPFPEIGKLPRPIVRTGWLLGAAHRVAGQYDQAERHLHEALEGCRRINMVDHEAGILIDLARLRAETGAPGDAERLAEEARVIADRSSYVLQGADAHLELAKLAAARGDQPRAREHAQQAGTLATCDGPPDYTYKATYDEAIALLETLK